MELWDIYDINRNKTGKVTDRYSKERLHDQPISPRTEQNGIFYRIAGGGTDFVLRTVFACGIGKHCFKWNYYRHNIVWNWIVLCRNV